MFLPSLLLLQLSSLVFSSSSECNSFQLKSQYVYSCYAQQRSSIPSNIPTQTQILLLSFNRISSVSQDTIPDLPQLQVLTLGAQASSSIFTVGQSAFQHLHNLTKLDLGGNRNINLHPRAFDGMSRLEVLLLDSNGLTETVLESDLFRDLTSLRKLDLSFNQIRRLRPDPSFLALISLSSITLKLNRINLLCGNDLQNLHGRRLELLDLSSNQLLFFNASSCINPFQNISLGTLDISSMGWTTKSTRNFFTTITGTHVEHIKMEHASALGSNFGFNNLKDPDMETFSGLNLSEIRFFDLSNGFISKLVPQVFSAFPQLLSLDLSSNKISDIQPGAFSGLRHLVSLNLSSNLMGNILSFSFQGLEATTLEALDLSSNNIGAIQYKGLDGFVNLKSLNLKDNSLTIIPQVTLPKVTLVLLGQNRISNTYGLSSFSPSATYLDLSGNRLKDLRSLWEILEVQSLQHLFLGRNRLSYCSTANAAKMVAKSGLMYLDLSDNALGAIWKSGQCGNIFKNLGQLEYLNLARNQISSLPEELFQGLSTLRSLDLSGNSFRHLPSGLSFSLTSLKRLNLGSNSLLTLSSSFLEPMNSLERVDLSEVSFLCDCSLKEVWNWMLNKNISIQVDSGSMSCVQFPPAISETPLLIYLNNCAEKHRLMSIVQT